MKRRVIKVGLNSKSIDNAVKELQAYKKWLNDKAKLFVQELAKEGMNIAFVKFKQAEYDGKNDVSVYVDSRQGNAAAVVAVGQSVLFIEFGTGVVNPDDHPEKPDGIAARGTYGKGHGKQDTWGFYGDDKGTHGKYATVKIKGGGYAEKIPHVVLTHGNIANKCMYESKKELRDKILAIAKRVFKQ